MAEGTPCLVRNWLLQYSQFKYVNFLEMPFDIESNQTPSHQHHVSVSLLCLYVDFTKPAQLVLVVIQLPATGFKVCKGRSINSLLNIKTVTIKVSKTTRTCSCVGTVVLTEVLRAYFQLLHAHLKHYLQSLFNAHQRTRIIEVLSSFLAEAVGSVISAGTPICFIYSEVC